MKTIRMLVPGLLGGLFATTIGFADEGPPTPPPPAARTAEIPAHCLETVTQVPVPPATATRRVPVYETVAVPVYEERSVTEYQDVQVPVYDTIEVPVYRTEKVPVWGEREVTVCQEVCEPVKLCLWNPFGCEPAEIRLWNKTTLVPVGTEVRPAIVSYEEQQTLAGTRLERREVGTETRRVPAGTRLERIPNGTREERRIVGWTDETVVTAPASVREVREIREVPSECVTVVLDGAPPTVPLPGTSRVLTESEYADAIQRAREARAPRS
jgi:hypothetical protein